MIYFGGFMYMSIASIALLVDKYWVDIYVEILKNIIFLALVYYYGEWFMINSFFENGSTLILVYYMVCMLVAGYFHKLFQEEQKVPF